MKLTYQVISIVCKKKGVDQFYWSAEEWVDVSIFTSIVEK